jgi:hypothetical protein
MSDPAEKGLAKIPMGRSELLVGIERPVKAFLPEAYAYRDWFGLQADFRAVWLDEASRSELRTMSAAIVFRPWRFTLPKVPVRVLDRASPAVRIGARVRNAIKNMISARSHIVVTVGDLETGRMHHGAAVLRRRMGYFRNLVQPRNGRPSFWGVYAGTTERPGVKQTLRRISAAGLSIAVASRDRPFARSGNLDFLGPLSLPELYGLYAECRVGLNLVPESALFSLQQSTKLIEYCGTGLSIVSTDHLWSRRFLEELHGSWTPLRDVESFVLQGRAYPAPPDVTHLDWRVILDHLDLGTRIRQQLSSLTASN